MTPTRATAEAAPSAPRRRGRPQSEQSRRAVLDTAVELLDSAGYQGFTVDEVSRRSGVSKSTIYRRWATGLDIAAEAYGEAVTRAVPVRNTGDAVSDLRDQAVRLAAFYASARGKVVAQLLAAGIQDGHDAIALRTHFFAVRRAGTAELIEQGKAARQLRDDIPTELMIDLIFGPIVFRRVNGMRPLTRAEAKIVAAVALEALVTA